MKRLIANLTATGAVLGSLALATPALTPQGIIVNPVPTDLEVQTWVDRDPSGFGNSTYLFGDKIRISTRVNQDAYVYLFNINADGQIDLVLPNGYNPNNYLRAGETRTFPENGARYEFTISGPAGTDQVLAVASRQPLSLNQIADIRSGQMRVQGAGNLARALSIVVTPLPDRDWVSDVVRYNVQPRYANVPAPQPQPPVVVLPAPRPPVIIITPVPGWVVIWEDRDDDAYSVAYRGGNVRQVYGYYDRDLTAKGWVRIDLNSKGNRYYATYRRGDDTAQVNVIPVKGEIRVSLEWGR